ncbi:ABC transporter ATP-binding protein [Sporomusa sp.]|uniref:ABC transporter ATP-binding protein n=1 Tax=Sporomusa sp. TaxID=2078658 RepID=UPI002B6B2264|nr:ABC transporter ATP-binding protein [Sporomusa sp.]HWR43558.1 ABC transporter ATP-binding protein [Sporomusa sp.]
MINSKSVHVTNLEKIYEGQNNKQIVAVNKVSLAILPGEFVTLLGPSGCGKTTILRMIAGFEKPTGGDIYIGKEKVTSLTPDKRDTSMVFQSYALFPHLSVFENIAYGLKIKKLPAAVINEKVMAILDLVGLAGMEGRNPNQLSGGQQQRVALARSLVMEPGVLLFDEPLSNLDAKLRIHMRSEIRKIQQKVGITSIYVTHDQAEAMSMSDRVIVMNKGNIEQIGTPSEIYNKPSSQFVADFIGLANILDAEVVAVSPGTATVKCLDALFSVSTDLVLEPGKRVKAVFRPESVSLSDTGKIPAKVESSVFMGAYQDYKIAIGTQHCIILEYNPMHKKIFSPGDNVFLNLNEHSLHLVDA